MGVFNQTQPFDPCNYDNSTDASGDQSSSHDGFAVGVLVALLGSTGEQLGLTLWKLAENRVRDRESPRENASIEPMHSERRGMRRIRESIMGLSMQSIPESTHSRERKIRRSESNLNRSQDAKIVSRESLLIQENIECNPHSRSLSRQNSLADSVSSVFAQRDPGCTVCAAANTESAIYENPTTNSQESELAAKTVENSSEPENSKILTKNPVVGESEREFSRKTVVKFGSISGDPEISNTPTNNPDLHSQASGKLQETSSPGHNFHEEPDAGVLPLSHAATAESESAILTEQEYVLNPEPAIKFIDGCADDVGSRTAYADSIDSSVEPRQCKSRCNRRVTVKDPEPEPGATKLQVRRQQRCLDREGVLGLIAFCVFVMGNGLNFVALGMIQV